MPNLTERQLQVLSLRARGNPWHRIAARLYISECVAREHLQAITAKLAPYCGKASPHDLEWHLGLRPGDLGFYHTTAA